MRASGYDCQVTIERPVTTRDARYGTDVVTWVALSYLPGSPAVAEKFWAEVQDVMPSRAESVRQGLALARNQVRVRIPYRNDIDSTMRVTIHRDTSVVHSIVGGPSEVGGRKRRIEMVCERFSTEGRDG